MSLSYAAHINGDKVYDIATGYWIEAKQEAAASAGRLQWNVYLYDDEGTFVEKYAGGNFPENQADLWEFAGFDIVTSASTASWHVFTMYNHSSITSGNGTSATLKQYFSGEQGYAINADYAVIDVQPLSVDANGTYTAPFSKAYSPITVDVQEQPWQPLEDGYSNFWFELTDDTLSPWLNFLAKTEDAVIDWGDGSGEVALDTLTPTHTYARAGKYVVKVKGVTGITAQGYIPYTAYSDILTHFELTSDVTVIANTSFRGAQNLTSFTMTDYITTIGTTAFAYCSRIKGKVTIPPIEDIPVSMCLFCPSINEIEFKAGTSTIGNTAFYYNTALTKITMPSTMTSIGQAAFNSCVSLSEIHIQATTPPTLGTNALQNITSNFIIYVPVGTGETYKAAAGWSTYADHILEEGQTPNRAMLSRLAKAVETDTDEDMR